MAHRISRDATFHHPENSICFYKQPVGTAYLLVATVSVQRNPIGDTYSFVTVEWGAKFEKTGGQLIHFKISYLLQFTQDEPKILAYVDHEDQQKVMKEFGLV